MVVGGQAKYKPYPAHKASGVEWLGDIPGGWEATRLKYVVNQARQITYGIVQAGPNIEHGIPYIRPADMTDESGIRDFAGLLRTSPQIATEYSRSKIAAGDIVCSIGPSFGKVMIVPSSLDEANLTQGTARIAINAENSSRFIFWVLRSPTSFHQWESGIGGATFRALNLGPLAETALARPTYNEQTNIAAFLDHETAKIDALIAKQQRLIALLEEKRQAVISHAVTKGLNPATPMKGSGVDWVGEIPAHWRIVPLLAVSEVIDPNPSHRNPEYVDEGFPFISTQEFIGRDGIITDTPRRVSEKTVLEQEARCNFQVGSIVFSRKGTIGATRVLPTGVRLGILDSLCVINPKRGIMPEFLADILTAYYLVAQYGPIVNGAALPQLSVGKIRSLKLILPPHHEQMQIVRYVDEMLEKHEVLYSKAQSAITLLKERRTALISAAVTGKIDLRDWQPPEGASAPYTQDIYQTEEALA